MSRKPIKKPDTPTEIILSEDLIFRPTYEQVQVKIAFWTKYSINPTVDTNNITLSVVQKLVPIEPRLARWWSLMGFQEWFLNQEEFVERVNSLAYLALSALEDILTNPDANANARISAARLAFEASNKMPKKDSQRVVYADDLIQKMDQPQLEAYLRQKSLLISGDGSK